jgi:hypothetical protein
MTGIAKKISPLLNASGDAAPASAESYISDPALTRYLRDLELIDSDDCFFAAMGRLHAGEMRCVITGASIRPSGNRQRRAPSARTRESWRSTCSPAHTRT